MATLMHTIKSSILSGAGMVGCGPYGGEDNLKNPVPPDEEVYDIEVFAGKFMNSLVNNITGWARNYEKTTKSTSLPTWKGIEFM